MGISVASGDLIRQKYRVEKVLGEGGMGVVVAAWHLHLERRVAIKFLLPEMLVHPEVVERFLREGRAASAIEGEHVAKVIDVDTLEDGTPFLVMEHLDGMDLGRVVEGGEKLPVAQVVAWVLEACTAVAEAHRLGIVHRDLKPSNLFLATGRDGRQRVKVLDFGISKVAETGSRSLTRTSMGMGSAEYMSPEQCLSARDVDARADVWALGVILYELLTLRVPYAGDNATQVYAQATAGLPAPPSRLRPDLPEGLDAAILGCLEKNVGKRTPTVAALVEKLTPYAGTGRPEPYQLARGRTAVLGGVGQPNDATELNPSAPVEVPAQAVTRLEGATAAGVVASSGHDGGYPEPPGLAERRSWPAFVAVALALSVAAGTALLLTRGGAPPQAAPVPVAPTATAAPPSPTAPASVAGPVVVPAPGPASASAVTATSAPAPRSSALPRVAPTSTGTKSKAYDPTKEM